MIKQLASFSFLFLAIAFITLTLFNAYEPTRQVTTTLFLLLTLVLYYPLRLIIANNRLSLTYNALIKDKDASRLIMFYIKLPFFLIVIPLVGGAFFLLFIKASVLLSLNARWIILTLGAFVVLFLFWTFLGNKLLQSRDTIARLYAKNRLDQKLGYHLLLFMLFFSLTSDLMEAFIITLLFSFLIFDVLFGLHTKVNLHKLFFDQGVVLAFKFLLFSLVSLLSYKYLREMLNHEVERFVLWIDPTASVIFIFLFLYIISGVGNYVQLNLLISYLVKKPARQFAIVWSMMAVLYLGLTLMHLKFEHFSTMKKTIESYQNSLR
ncbi:MAG: hypothetical protein IBX43_01860 [Campylobacterales bacterium]|nr:hypothetical protein [Campylobacterales bacterium]